MVLSYDTNASRDYSASILRYEKCVGDMISVYGHTAKNIVTHIRRTERAQETRSEPAAGVSRKY